MSTGTWRYVHCGLRVDSQIRLPELTEGWPGEASEPALRVRFDAPLRNPVECHRLCSDGDVCRLLAPGAGSYEIRGGREIRIRRQPGADPALLRLFVLGSAWGALLHQRGELALHGGVVLSGDGSATAVCGPPRAGKSSLVAALLRRGHPLVADDLARVQLTPAGAASVWPSVRRLKLSPEAVARHGWNTEGLESEPPVGKLHLRWSGAFAEGPADLRRVYVLKWGELRRTRLTGRIAVERLIAACTYRPQLLRSAAAQVAYWRLCVALAQHVEVWELSHPRDWTAVDGVLDLVRENMRPPARSGTRAGRTCGE